VPGTLSALVGRIFQLDPFPDGEIISTHYPLVLIHGFGALGTLFSSGLLHAQAAGLRQRGVLAFAPNVPPYDTTAARCVHWERHLERILEMSGAERLNLVGYSAGGLDARHLVSQRGFADRVASVITVATPNRGSELASWSLDGGGALRAVAMRAMTTMGRMAFHDAPPRVADGLRELCPEHVEGTFNPANPDAPGVFYGSFAARAGLGTDTRITPLLLTQNRILYPLAGANDGMVSVESAPWGELLGFIRSDHLRLCGVAPGSRGHSMRFFLHLARELAARGF
jgi:triacylglycerol lipase